MNVDTNTIKPVGPFILVKFKSRAKEVEKSGIIISDDVAKRMDDQESNRTGEVVAVGTTCKNGLDVGHKLIFRPAAQGHVVGETDAAEDLVLMHEDLVMAIVNHGE